MQSPTLLSLNTWEERNALRIRRWSQNWRIPTLLIKQFWQRLMNTYSRQYKTYLRGYIFRPPWFGDGWSTLLILSWRIFIRSFMNWMMHNWEQRRKSQTNSWELCIQLSIKIDSISLPLMSCGFIYQQITKLSSYRRVNRCWNRKIIIHIKKDAHNRMEFSQISHCRHLPERKNI
jgi:hypothetical protein